MAGFDIANSHSGTIPGGIRVECGDYTNSGDGTIFVPTQFTTLFGGVCYGDLTDACGGRAVSLCSGPTIRFAMGDSTGMASVGYIAFGA